METSKLKIKICFGYEWPKNNGFDPKIAFNKLIKSVIQDKRIKNIKIQFYIKRLRGKAGGYIFDNIYKMIKDSDIIIFDITTGNPNVIFELGIAFAIKKEINPNLSIYLISKDELNIISNIAEYLISIYSYKNEQIIFSDNSLRMSVLYDIINILVKNDLYPNKDKIISLIDEE